MDYGLVGFLGRIDSAGTGDAAWLATLDFLREEGVEHVHYAFRDTTGGSAAWRRRTTLPEWWLDLYAHRGFASVDPGRAHFERSCEPVLTGADFAPAQTVPLRTAFHEESRSLGIKNGFVVPLRRERRERAGAFACETRFSRSELERWFARIGSTLVMALYYADARHRELVRDEAARAIRLTIRERECLLWLAKGLRNDRISERMGISNPTVEMHLANARRKLGAFTREQALARAVALRLISP
jgi:DNA-binding CsgD family transcriptional regulator